MTDNDFVTHTEFEAFRIEVRAEFEDVRREMREEFAALRREMREMRDELRQEMREAVALLTARLDRHERWLSVLSSVQVLMILLLIYVVFKLGL